MFTTMGLFRRDRRSTDQELKPELLSRLDRIEERLAQQEKGLKTLELDWQEWFDKFRLLYARLTKRVRDAINATPEVEHEKSREDAPGPTISSRGGPTPTRRNY